MSDEPQDVEEITAICGGLNINIGTLNVRTIEGMLKAGHKANELRHMVLLDPVGAGASSLRTNTAVKLMQELKVDVIRGNISEVKTLAAGSGTTKGVDADVADAVSEENLDEAVAFAKKFAEKIRRKGKAPCEYVSFSATRHEIYSSDDITMKKYMERILNFLGEKSV